ncbi:MAG TPA: hypothetical protein VFQ53_23545 [Kofleriaceae bacterium]|nr:hypothetical protein [Kofleriaceae bacterium]
MKRVVAAILAPAFDPRLRACAARLARTTVERIAVVGPTRANVFAGMPVVTLPAGRRPLATALGWALRGSCDGVLLVDAAGLELRIDFDAMLARFEHAHAVATRHASGIDLPAVIGVPLFGRFVRRAPGVVLATTPGVELVAGLEIAAPRPVEESNDLVQVA